MSASTTTSSTDRPPLIQDGFQRWGLTALLLAAALYAAFRAGRKSPPATRVGYGLHAAMMAAMVPMLTPGPLWPALPQILFFGLAAWWFVLRAVSRRPVPAGLTAPVVKPAQDRRAGTPRRQDRRPPGCQVRRRRTTAGPSVFWARHRWQ